MSLALRENTFGFVNL